jgi:hypothetical protein
MGVTRLVWFIRKQRRVGLSLGVHPCELKSVQAQARVACLPRMQLDK